MLTRPSLVDVLADRFGTHAVLTDDAALALAANDAFVVGERPLAVVRPPTEALVAEAIELTTERGVAVIPRGGGLSYTGGYASPTPQAIVLDTRALTRIGPVSADDRQVTVGAGATWAAIDAALSPHGLRLPFFGTFSGAGATVGGGLSHGALFHGSARHGGAADIVAGLTVALADGSLLRTTAGAGGREGWRGFGPDLTSMFLHDGGAFGVKTSATFRVVRAPAALRFASFAFDDLAAAGAALAAVARDDLAEDVYVLAGSTAAAARVGVRERARMGAKMLRAAWRAGNGASAVSAVASGVPVAPWLLHLTVAGRAAAHAEADLADVRRVVRALGGRAVAPTVPLAVRADPFPSLRGIVGADGARWAALNAKVPHAELADLLAAVARVLEDAAPACAAVGVRHHELLSALGPAYASYEVVLHWRDSFAPLHRDILQATGAAVPEPQPDPAARAEVERLRSAIVETFQSVGAASSQIGRTYPFLDAIAPERALLLRAFKTAVDPRGLMNPGVLRL